MKLGPFRIAAVNSREINRPGIEHDTRTVVCLQPRCDMQGSIQVSFPMVAVRPTSPWSSAPEPSMWHGLFSSVLGPYSEGLCIGITLCCLLRQLPFIVGFGETTMHPSKTVRDRRQSCHVQQQQQLASMSDGLIKALGLINCLTTANSVAIRQHH